MAVTPHDQDIRFSLGDLRTALVTTVLLPRLLPEATTLELFLAEVSSDVSLGALCVLLE